MWLNGYKIILYTLRFCGAFIFIKYITNDIVYFFIFQLVVAVLEFFIIKNKLYSLSKFSNFVAPSFERLKTLAPFALSVAYGAILWMFITQIDKLMLSHYLPLKEYGYFSIVVVVANAIMLMFQPIGQAILPRMTNLISNGDREEVVRLYRQYTQIVSIVIFSIVAVIVSFPYELLYAWTGNIEASFWSKDILRWYVAGNGVVAFLTLLYYLQHSHGNLKYHTKGNTYFGVVQILAIFLAVHYYGALGAGIAFFALQLIIFLFWSSFIHSKFLPNIQKQWLIYDIVVYGALTLISILLMKYIFGTFENYSRIELFCNLFFIGLITLLTNISLFMARKNY